MGWRFGGLLAAAAVAAALTGSPAQAAATVSPGTLGVYRGPAAAGSVASYGTWLGRAMTWAQDFLPRDNWAAIEDPSWITDAWRSTPYRLVLTVPMIPDSGGSLQAGASGAYDIHFRKLAEALVAQGQAGVVLRLGPEFNGDWFPWTAQGREAPFAAYWRHIVDAMRSVPGQHFTFDWCPNMGSQKAAAEQAYPGDAYVDYVGLDAYDQDWMPGWQDATTRWHNLVTMPYGLQWQQDFASRHGKLTTLPEWGVYTRPDGHGGGDDPYYVRQMSAWIAAHDFAYEIYFEFDAGDGSHRLMTSEFPKASEAFRQLFGSIAPAAPAVATPAAPAAAAQPKPAVVTTTTPAAKARKSAPKRRVASDARTRPRRVAVLARRR